MSFKEQATRVTLATLLGLAVASYAVGGRQDGCTGEVRWFEKREIAECPKGDGFQLTTRDGENYVFEGKFRYLRRQGTYIFVTGKDNGCFIAMIDADKVIEVNTGENASYISSVTPDNIRYYEMRDYQYEGEYAEFTMDRQTGVIQPGQTYWIPVGLHMGGYCDK